MASSEDLSCSPQRMEEGDFSDSGASPTGGQSKEIDLDHQYSPTNPTEGGQSKETDLDHQYSPTNPTEGGQSKETDLDHQYSPINPTEGGQSKETDLDHQYSPTSPTDSGPTAHSPSDMSQPTGAVDGGEYSPTSPTDDGDDLEAIFGSTQPEENCVPDEDGSGEDSPSAVLDIDRPDSDDNQNTESDNRLVLEDEAEDEQSGNATTEEMKEECQEEREIECDEEEKERDLEDGLSEGLGASQEPASRFDISETFLDNMNPQDDSQDDDDGDLEEREQQAGGEQEEGVTTNNRLLSADVQEKPEDGYPSSEEKEETVHNTQENEDSSPELQEMEDTSVGLQEKQDSPPSLEEKEEASPDPDRKEEDILQEGDNLASEADNSPGGTASDARHLLTDNDLEARDEDTKPNYKDEQASEEEPDSKTCEQSPEYQSSPAADDDDDNSPRKEDDSAQGVVAREQSAEEEEDCSSNQASIDKDGKSQHSSCTSGDGVDVRVDLDNNTDGAEPSFDYSSEGVPAVGVTQENVDKDPAEAGSETVHANESEDEVQIIEGPPQDPIDTLIVDDDEEEEEGEAVASGADGEKASDSQAAQNTRTVEQDGQDLRIVIHEEQPDKEESDSRRRRHERDRREERRSDSRRRSESDRKSSDRSSRRRHHRSRSRSRDRRRKRSRSRSRERSSRRRRHRDRSRDRSSEKEKYSHRKRRRERSRERRHRSRSRSRSPRRGDSWDKENHDDLSEHESSKHSRSKRRRYRHHEEKGDESSEDDKSEQKQESPEVESGGQQHARTWSPSDTFQKDPSDTPTPGPSPTQAEEESQDEIVHKEEEEEEEEVSQQAVIVAREDRRGHFPGKDQDYILTENIPIPQPVNMRVLEPPNVSVPPPVHIPVLHLMPAPQLKLCVDAPPPPPVPEEEPERNPPEPPAFPPPPPARRPDGLPHRGEGLLPTPIRRKAALEESARKVAMEEAVYDPAHPTDEDTERLIFPGGPNAPMPHPDMMGGPPRLPGQLLSDGTFVVPGPGEGGLLGPPPQRVPLSSMSFSPHRPMLVNHVLFSRPPFSNGPFSAPLPGSPLTRFRLQMSGPGGAIQMPGQFGQHLPPGPPPPPQGFPGQLSDRFEDGPPPPMGQFPGSLPPGLPELKEGLPPPLGQFPVSLPSGFPDMKERPPPLMGQYPVSLPSGLAEMKEGLPPMGQFPVSLPAGLGEMKEPPPMRQFPVSLPSGLPELPTLTAPPPGLHLLSQQPPPGMARQDSQGEEDKMDKTLANLVVAQNLLSVIKDGKLGASDPTSLVPSSVFKVPLPPGPTVKPPPAAGTTRFRPSAPVGERTEDSTEVMDMDMSPLDEDCELELPTPPDVAQEGGDKAKNAKPLAAIDIKALSNAIKQLTSQPADNIPASAADQTNKEKYLKKLHLQERVEDEVKQAIRPFYSHKKITKEEYKEILRKAVPKVCHSKSGDVNPQKIQQLVEGYVNKFQKQRQEMDSKPTPAKPSPKDKAKVNGERAKPSR